MTAPPAGIDRDRMARVVAADIEPGSYVNLGIGLPTRVANYLDPAAGIMLHTENGLLGMGPEAVGDLVDPELINAGKIPVTEAPGASYFHHADSFAMMRGGHLDICVLGAFQVAANGDLANWHTGEPDAIPAVGGAMDLAIGAKQTFVMMNLLTREGAAKLVAECTYPLTGLGCVSRVYTDLAVFLITGEGVTVRETYGLGFAGLQDLIGFPLIDGTGRAVNTTRTRVGIVGGGPAGLMLSHLLARAAIPSIVVDNRSRHDIATTVRAGILEAESVRMLTDTGVSDRVLREGQPHEGIALRFGGASHRIDFKGLVGACTWLYPQTDVFIDLAAARERDGGDVRFGVSGTRVLDVTSAQPGIAFTDADGVAREVRCDVLVGADGSRSVCRLEVAEAARRHYFKEYPFAWFGLLVEAPKSAPELIYNHSPRGFALISQRTETLQRMYFQCDPATDPADWSDDRIWAELHARLAGADGFELKTGRIAEKSVLPFRSFVAEPMRYGNMLLAGDAAHTVPPTGAKGLNLALADARVLAEVLERALVRGDRDALDEYSPRALARVWRSQHFSYWMTTMLHALPEATDFDVKRQLAELSSVAGSAAGSAYLAEAYTGWPSRR